MLAVAVGFGEAVQMAAGPDGSAQVLDATLADDSRVEADLKTIRVTCLDGTSPAAIAACPTWARVGCVSTAHS